MVQHIYTSASSNLPARKEQHKTVKYKTSFTNSYNITELVYFEVFRSIVDAISGEKQIKAGSFQKKLDLINGLNPEWKDLTDKFS